MKLNVTNDIFNLSNMLFVSHVVIVAIFTPTVAFI